MISGRTGVRTQRSTVRRLVQLGLLIATIALTAVPVFGQTNPFLDRPSPETAPAEEGPPVTDHSPAGSLRWGGGPLGRIWASARSVLVSWQRGLNRSLGLRLRSLSTDDPGMLALIGALGFAFAFGFLHAVLPGHRKSVLISYCVADNARIVHGIIPCPITTALMLFAVSINAVALGIAAVVALSAGLGLALAVLAIMTIVIKDRVLVLFAHKAGHMLHAGVELAGGVMILAVGLFTLALLV